MAIKVSQKTVDEIRKRSMEENLRLLRSGKLNAEQTEAMRRFYPKQFAQDSGLQGRPTAHPVAPKKQDSTENIRFSAILRRLEKEKGSRPVPAPGSKKKKPKKYEEISPSTRRNLEQGVF